MIAVQRRPKPRTRPRVVRRRRGVSVSDLDTVVVEKYIPLDPCAITAECNDSVLEGGVLRRSAETTNPCTGFTADVIHRENFAVVEADIQREDLGIEAKRPQEEWHPDGTIAGQQRLHVGGLRSNADD